MGTRKSRVKRRKEPSVKTRSKSPETNHQNRNQIESPNHFSNSGKKNILKFKVIIFNHNEN
jgi:hypothetical protein